MQGEKYIALYQVVSVFVSMCVVEGEGEGESLLLC